ERFPDIFREWYHSEVRSAEAALQAFQVGRPTMETRGLRLALLSFGSHDAKELRRQITTRAILDILGTCGGCSSAKVAQTLSSDLGLPTPLSEGYVNSILQTTTLQNLTRKTGAGAWQLTDLGAEEAESVPPEAAKEVLAGRTIVR